jgi:hypothetical protein
LAATTKREENRVTGSRYALNIPTWGGSIFNYITRFR